MLLLGNDGQHIASIQVSAVNIKMIKINRTCTNSHTSSFSKLKGGS